MLGRWAVSVLAQRQTVSFPTRSRGVRHQRLWLRIIPGPRWCKKVTITRFEGLFRNIGLQGNHSTSLCLRKRGNAELAVFIDYKLARHNGRFPRRELTRR